MSSPSRQMHTRRLPPLPGAARRGAVSPGVTSPGPGPVLNPRSPRRNNEMMVTGQPLNGLHNSNREMNEDSVKIYLKEHPEFLEKYIFRHVPPDIVENWVKKRYRQINEDYHVEKDKNTSGNESSLEDTEKVEKCQHLAQLTKNIWQQPNQAFLLYELSQTVAKAINADGGNLYMCDSSTNQIYYFTEKFSDRSVSPLVRDVGEGSCLAAFVAHVRKTTRVDEILGDERYPEGLGPANGGGSAQSVLAFPIIHLDTEELLGVIELYRTVGHTPFNEDEQESGEILLTHLNYLLPCQKMYYNMTRQRKLNEFLLSVAKSIFQDISMDTVIMKIMDFAKKLVQADRTALFLLDNKSRQLYARVFDMGTDEKESTALSIQKEIRFPMDKGVAGYVSTTGETVNIHDAYSDERFNRQVDIQTGYTTKTILCMPIKLKKTIIGVVQMLNKSNGIFTKDDEEAFESFGIYCGLALYHAKLYDKIRRSEQKYKVALEVLSYHSQAVEDEVSKLADVPLPEKCENITKFDFSPWSLDNKPLYVYYMFNDLFGMATFDAKTLMRFTLTVRKNYRNVPYHNWEHAFSVAHAMYTILKNTDNQFTMIEKIGLFVGSLCHDLDHRGKTNSFMVKSSSPLAAIYSTSTMEHHHFNQTVSILQHDGHNIFNTLSSDEYRQILSNIRHCILATDLALFFPNKSHLRNNIDEGTFSWQNDNCRNLLMAISMTASDLCSMYKPWNLQLKLVNVIMEEFWQQGDDEKKKEEGTITMMDREKYYELPQLEVGFLVGICLPCYELITEIFPDATPIVTGAKENLKQWQMLAAISEEERKTELLKLLKISFPRKT